jgi:hypothetical protein
VLSEPVELTLGDGAAVLIQPIRPEHKAALQRGFERLSDQSRAAGPREATPPQASEASSSPGSVTGALQAKCSQT